MLWVLQNICYVNGIEHKVSYIKKASVFPVQVESMSFDFFSAWKFNLMSDVCPNLLEHISGSALFKQHCVNLFVH